MQGTGGKPIEGRDWIIPQLPLDNMLGELQARLEAVRSARDGIHALLDSVVSIGSQLDLEMTLRAIVEAATNLVDARYGALGVIGADGQLAKFVPVGVTNEEILAIEEWPHGRGLLGLLIHDPQPLRLSDIGTHPQSHGFPEGHASMRTFLGVPIRVRGEVFGNLFLTEKSGGREFNEQDERVLTALATAAGVAVDNARLYEESQRRETWLDASAEVTRLLLSGAEPQEALDLIVSRAREMSGADAGALAVPSEQAGTMAVAAVSGAGYSDLAGFVFPAVGTLLSSVFESGKAASVIDVQDSSEAAPLVFRLPNKHVLLVPLGEVDHVRGVLVIGKRHETFPFLDAALRMLSAFAGQAAIVLELADTRRDAERYQLAEDRARIARDLHDLVIQRLFAMAMTLANAVPLVGRPEVSRRVQDVVDDLDKTIREIRSTIFGLQLNEHGSTGRLRTRILDTVDKVVEQMGFMPGLRIDGLIDSAVPDAAGEQLLVSLREMLSNVARRANASHAQVAVELVEGRLRLGVSDDGVGLSDGGRRSGLANCARRAERLGGSFEAHRRDDGGTVVRWEVPV